MSSIKNLKSGATPPIGNGGLSEISDSAANLTINWGGMSVVPLIQKQSNATRGVVIKKQGS